MISIPCLEISSSRTREHPAILTIVGRSNLTLFHKPPPLLWQIQYLDPTCGPVTGSYWFLDWALVGNRVIHDEETEEQSMHFWSGITHAARVDYRFQKKTPARIPMIYSDANCLTHAQVRLMVYWSLNMSSSHRDRSSWNSWRLMTSLILKCQQCTEVMLSCSDESLEFTQKSSIRWQYRLIDASFDSKWRFSPWMMIPRVWGFGQMSCSSSSLYIFNPEE